MFKPSMLAIGLIAATTVGAYADPSNSNGNGPGQNSGGGHQYETKDGHSFSNPGEMFQYLRDRDNGLANGNPKEIVEAYPEEFENVGDLIQQKRVDE